MATPVPTFIDLCRNQVRGDRRAAFGFSQSQADSEILLAQTVEMQALDGAVDNGVSFEGIGDISDALERATVGGLIAGKDLLLIATTLAGVRRLRRLVENAELELSQLTRLVEQVRTYPELEQDIHHCIDDRGDVTDRASPKLEGIRVKIKGAREQIYQTLQRIMQRHSGSIQEAVITNGAIALCYPLRQGKRNKFLASSTIFPARARPFTSNPRGLWSWVIASARL